jgi:hypothetical protein
VSRMSPFHPCLGQSRHGKPLIIETVIICSVQEARNANVVIRGARKISPPATHDGLRVHAFAERSPMDVGGARCTHAGPKC